MYFHSRIFNTIISVAVRIQKQEHKHSYLSEIKALRKSSWYIVILYYDTLWWEKPNLRQRNEKWPWKEIAAGQWVLAEREIIVMFGLNKKTTTSGNLGFGKEIVISPA